jgi:glycine betaine/proline transport system permease protein
LPLGIAAALSDPVDRALRPVLDTLQTMPAFVYLIPVVALFNIGRVPGVIATVVYSLPPLVRLTSSGIRGLPDETIEAARATGCTPGQLLRTVQLPLARPQILLGVNQTIMMALASIVIAGLIGAGGLGIETVLALTRGEVGRGVEAALAIVLLGIVLDRITQSFGSDDEAARATVKTA